MMLPKDDAGELLPLDCPLECCVFGTGVYVMVWTRFMRAFFIAFVVALRTSC